MTLRLGVSERKLAVAIIDSVIADMFETFIGALYLDQDLVVCFKLLDALISEYIIVDNSIIDYKTSFKNYVQSDKRCNIEYQLLSTKGPSNDPVLKWLLK